MIKASHSNWIKKIKIQLHTVYKQHTLDSKTQAGSKKMGQRYTRQIINVR